jgi:hypothetical protein
MEQALQVKANEKEVVLLMSGECIGKREVIRELTEKEKNYEFLSIEV